jgi:hypothetical protein
LSPREFDPGLFIKKGAELPLSGPGLLELMRAVLSKGVPFRFQSKGFSMLPFIHEGDLVTVSPLSGAAPRLGDVVAYAAVELERVVVHRVVGRSGGAWLVKGDNNPGADGLIVQAQILGRVTRVERDGREVSLGLGPERWLIARLARSGLLWSYLLPAWRRLCNRTRGSQA